jgi:hypothetical protein
LAISTICRLATERSRTSISGSIADVQPPKQVGGHPPHFAVIDETEPVFRLAADPDIFSNRHERHQVQFLMDHRNAVFQRVQR